MACLEDYVAGTRVIPLPEEERERFWPFTVNFHVCLTDTEATALRLGLGEGFKPSELRCMLATPEGMKAMTKWLTPNDAMVPLDYATYITLEERDDICRKDDGG